VTGGAGTIAGEAGGGTIAGGAGAGAIAGGAGGGTMAGEAGGGAMTGETGAGTTTGEAGGGAIAGEAGAGETGTSGVCGAVFGVDGLNVGGGDGGGATGLTVCCARAWPMAKAAIIAVSDNAAKSAAAGRPNPVAAMPISLSSVGGPNALAHRQQYGSRAIQTIRSFEAKELSRNRHARARRGHPRLKGREETKTWMAGTSPPMTDLWTAGIARPALARQRIAPDSVNEI